MSLIEKFKKREVVIVFKKGKDSVEDLQRLMKHIFPNGNVPKGTADIYTASQYQENWISYNYSSIRLFDVPEFKNLSEFIAELDVQQKGEIVGYQVKSHIGAGIIRLLTLILNISATRIISPINKEDSKFHVIQANDLTEYFNPIYKEVKVEMYVDTNSAGKVKVEVTKKEIKFSNSNVPLTKEKAIKLLGILSKIDYINTELLHNFGGASVINEIDLLGYSYVNVSDLQKVVEKFQEMQ